MALPTSEHVIIVETGDVLFTLRNPGTAFAVWERAVEEDSEIEKTEEEREEYKDKKQDEPSKHMTSSEILTHNSNRPAPSKALHPVVVYQVSSQHLITASPKFKNEFTSWSESLKGDDGYYHISTTDWDPEAFSILLNILHLRFRQVPRSLSLDLLAKVAMLVDYYRCWEAFDLIADVWITHLRADHPLPEDYSRNLMLWLLISWVFKLEEEFTLVTLRVLRQSDEPDIRDMELGIPQAILEKLETRRSQIFQDALGVCHGWLVKLCGDYSCDQNKDLSFECGSMLLGALTKQMKKIGILSPRPAKSLRGFSLEGLNNSIKSMKTPTWGVQAYRWEDNVCVTYTSRHPCSLYPVIQDFNDIVDRVHGLMLREFMDRAENTLSVVRRHG